MNFGDNVIVSEILYRACEYRERKRYSGLEQPQPYKVWKPKSIEPRKAILIGFRTLSNGFIFWETDVGWIFDREESFRAALVVFSEKENPVFAKIDGLKQAT